MPLGLPASLSSPPFFIVLHLVSTAHRPTDSLLKICVHPTRPPPLCLPPPPFRFDHLPSPNTPHQPPRMPSLPRPPQNTLVVNATTRPSSFLPRPSPPCTTPPIDTPRPPPLLRPPVPHANPSPNPDCLLRDSSTSVRSGSNIRLCPVSLCRGDPPPRPSNFASLPPPPHPSPSHGCAGTGEAASRMPDQPLNRCPASARAPPSAMRPPQDRHCEPGDAIVMAPPPPGGSKNQIFPPLSPFPPPPLSLLSVPPPLLTAEAPNPPPIAASNPGQRRPVRESASEWFGLRKRSRFRTPGIAASCGG